VNRPQVILITGASSGIGLAVAREAVRRGHRVFASARRPEMLAGETGMQTLRLDVTEPGAAARAVAEILGREGRLDALVNNAGYAQYGATEDVSAERWRQQYDVAVFGAIETIRAALPALREAGGGTIVNVSSVGGKVTVPFAAPYCSAKHALESISDSLRVELAPFGTRVVVVEPGPVDTRFDERAISEVADILKGSGPYAPYYRDVESAMKGAFASGKVKPEVVARVVMNAIESRRPRPRYRITAMSHLLIPLNPLLPDRLLDWMYRRTLKVPKKASRAS
jgi:NAD(P)-dependent dehydrogenase (short-subunit alcohol dehydrogenase family)